MLDFLTTTTGLLRCPSDSVKGYQRKFMGTPLVTYLEEPISGADIDVAFSRLLSPLKRTCSSGKLQNGKENGFVWFRQ